MAVLNQSRLMTGRPGKRIAANYSRTPTTSEHRTFSGTLCAHKPILLSKHSGYVFPESVHTPLTTALRREKKAINLSQRSAYFVKAPRIPPEPYIGIYLVQVEELRQGDAEGPLRVTPWKRPLLPPLHQGHLAVEHLLERLRARLQHTHHSRRQPNDTRHTDKDTSGVEGRFVNSSGALPCRCTGRATPSYAPHATGHAPTGPLSRRRQDAASKSTAPTNIGPRSLKQGNKAHTTTIANRNNRHPVSKTVQRNKRCRRTFVQR